MTVNVNPLWEKAENLARAAELKASEPKASPAMKASAKALRAKADALKAPAVAPTMPSGANAVVLPKPVKGARLELKAPTTAKPSNGVTVVAKPEAAPTKAPPVVATAKPSPAPTVAPTPVAAPAAPSIAFTPFWGVILTGGGELCPVKVTGERMVGKGDNAKPVYVGDVYHVAADAPDATTVGGLKVRGPLAGVAVSSGGVLTGQDNAGFEGITVDPSKVLPVTKGQTMAKLCDGINATVRAVYTPIAAPKVGETARWYAPLDGAGSAPGVSRPVDVTVTAVDGNRVTGTADGWKEPLTLDDSHTADGVRTSGRWYELPVPVGVPLLRPVFDARWSLRAALYRGAGPTASHDQIAAVESALLACDVAPVGGTESLTF